MTAPPISTKQYVERREQGYWIVGTRISLDSVIYAFLNGQSPESIVQDFPLLQLEQVYGCITFYLANREFVEQYLQQGETAFQDLQQSLRTRNPLLYQKLKRAQAQRSASV
jgi:uncharacterized protein (DUF433 family)